MSSTATPKPAATATPKPGGGSTNVGPPLPSANYESQLAQYRSQLEAMQGRYEEAISRGESLASTVSSLQNDWGQERSAWMGQLSSVVEDFTRHRNELESRWSNERSEMQNRFEAERGEWQGRMTALQSDAERWQQEAEQSRRESADFDLDRLRRGSTSSGGGGGGGVDQVAARLGSGTARFSASETSGMDRALSAGDRLTPASDIVQMLGTGNRAQARAGATSGMRPVASNYYKSRFG